MSNKRHAEQEPAYPTHGGTLRDHLYELADASLAIVEYDYKLQHRSETRDFTRIITSEQISTWNELIAGHFKEIVNQRGLTPAQRRDLLSRKLQAQEILTVSTVNALTNALVIVWKDRTREQLRSHFDPKRLTRRSRIAEGEAQASELANQAENERIAKIAQAEEAEAEELRLQAIDDAASQQAASRLEEAARLKTLREEYLERLRENYVATVQSQALPADDTALSIDQRREIEVEFVTAWFQNKNNVRLTVQLNGDQIRAIARMDKRLLVRARAGSGKTTTLVARTVFLLQHCKVSPL